MSNTNGPANVNNQSAGVENGRKRKWTTQMMKTWVATNPSCTAPEIYHRDPKAAARAEKKKRRKIEEETRAPTYRDYREAQPALQNPDAFRLNLPEEFSGFSREAYIPAYTRAWDGSAMPPPPEAYGAVEYPATSGTSGANMHILDALIPFEEEKRSTWAWSTIALEHELESASWSSPEGSERELSQGPTSAYAEAGFAATAMGRTGSSDGRVRDEFGARKLSIHDEKTEDGGGDIAMDLTEDGANTPCDSNERCSRPGINSNPGPTSEGEQDGATQEIREFGQEGPSSSAPANATQRLPPPRGADEPDGGEAGQRSTGKDRSGLELDAEQEPTDAHLGPTSTVEEEGSSESESNSTQERIERTQDRRDAQNSTSAGQLERSGHASEGPSDGENVGTMASEFNAGWRRYGPQGEDICDYVPHFSDSPKIRWPTGVRTLAPYIPTGDQRRGMKNKLKWDQIYTTTAARKFKSSRDRPDICVHATFTTQAEAVKLIRQCMAKGLPLVFDDYPDSLRWACASSTVDDDPFMDPVRWSDDEVEGVVGANLLSPRDFQDAAVREKEELAPYITATLLEFHTWLKLPGVVRCILDLTCGFPQSDDLTNRIADNVVQSVSQTYGNKYSGHSTVAADMMKTQDWFLLHTSGFLTFGHMDASGMATSAQIRGAGMKQWIIYKATKTPAPKPTDTRRAREKAMDALVTRLHELIEAASDERLEPKKRKSKDWQVDGCIIELRPGMKYFQPSGTVHAAYTPVPTAAAGKHFFTYDDLHRVEVSRRIQAKYPGTTNHNHTCGVQLMLISMAASIPIKAMGGRVFFRKPSIAMALMLTRPYDYIRDPSDNVDEDGEIAAVDEEDGEEQMAKRLRSPTWARDPFERLAHTVALRILNACKVKYPGDRKRQQPGREYIFEGESWEDPGPTIDMRKVTYDLIDTHVDDLSDGSGEDDSSDSDLTDLEDL
ncbi:hypothetical protein EV714DRAFT_275284 [Schizophyllum commune]